MAKRDVNVFEILDAQLADVSDSDTNWAGNRSSTLTWICWILILEISITCRESRNWRKISGWWGLQQPLRVRPKESGHFEIVTGHRRHRALLQLAKDEGLAEFSQVPCIRERTGESASMEKVRLICGNCDNRTITGAELADRERNWTRRFWACRKRDFHLRGGEGLMWPSCSMYLKPNWPT